MIPTIEIVVSPEGTTRVETKGFRGSDCRIASQFLEQALGQRQSETLKPEFHLPITSTQSVPQRS